MSNKRGLLFITQGAFVLILLHYIALPQLADMTHVGVLFLEWMMWGIYWLVSFLLPGRWWTYLFFSNETLTGGERVLMSLALSVAFLSFSLLYLPYMGVGYTPGISVIILAIWLAVGIIGVFGKDMLTISSYE